jgi:AbrB family looped-hinge helix DNA binding protein
MRTTLTERGQTAVPAKIRKKFHLDAQSKIEWVVEGNIIKVIPIPKDPVKAFEGALKGNLDFKKFIADRQKERREEAKKG